jgi:putative transposase
LFANHAGLAESLIGLYVEARDRRDIALHGYVVMPDHYHVVLTLVSDAVVSDLLRRVHSAFARRAQRDFGVTGRIWQRRFYDHVVRDEDEWREHIEYIHHNPVRAGLVEEACDYRWSSCSFWETGAGPATCVGPSW